MSKKQKTFAKDEFFSKEMMDCFDLCRIIKGSDVKHKQTFFAKQIKFLRTLGLLPVSHKHLTIDIN